MLTDVSLRLLTALSPAPEGAPNTGGHAAVMILFYGGLLAIFYFMLIRPQTKRNKEIQSMQAGLSKGDSVVTTGGVYATVHKIKEDIVTLQIAENVRIKVQRSSIAERLKESEKKKLEEAT